MVRALPSINSNGMVHALPRSNPARRSLFSHRPTVVATMSNLKRRSSSYWTSLNDEVESYLRQTIPMKPPLSFFEPMHHLTFSAPQTTAPALCVAACELVGGQRDQAMAAASALRIMHAAAFTHEQLPLTDKPRPMIRPTARHSYGPNVELLTGDGMAPFGIELLAESDDPTRNNSDRILRAIVEISRAMGSQGVVEGQYNELEYRKWEGGEEGVIERVCKKKEGEIHACAGACGGILGGGSEEEIEKLRRFGLYVGMIQGICRLVERSKRKQEWGVKEVRELRELALQELKDFKNKDKFQAIASFVEANVL